MINPNLAHHPFNIPLLVFKKVFFFPQVQHFTHPRKQISRAKVQHIQADLRATSVGNKT